MTLKPCPFCGSPAKSERYDPGMDRAPPCHFISCTKCPVRTRAVDTEIWVPHEGYTYVPDAEQLAADIWNTRA